MDQPVPTQHLILENAQFKGNLNFSGDMTFNGNLEGKISSDGNLIIGITGKVTGEISAKTVLLQGSVKGNITVEERCQLRSGSSLIGDLTAPRLIIEEGATFMGSSTVRPKGSK